MKKFILLAFLCSFCSCHLQALCWERYCLVNQNDPSDSFVFIFVPKNGSSTFRIVADTLTLTPYDHLRYEKSAKILIVRDPMFRSISTYTEVMKLRFEKNRTLSEDFYKNRENVAESFKQFLYTIRDDFYEPHITHQYTFLEEKKLSLDDIDYIFLFENLDEDTQLFCELNGIKYQKYRENPSSLPIKKILNDLILTDDEVRSLIYSIWEKDFEFYEAAKKRRSEMKEALSGNSGINDS